jgi:hypothetical protein
MLNLSLLEIIVSAWSHGLHFRKPYQLDAKAAGAILVNSTALFAGTGKRLHLARHAVRVKSTGTEGELIVKFGKKRKALIDDLSRGWVERP